MENSFKYNRTDVLSIFNYSKELIDKTLNSVVGEEKIHSRNGKGQLGQLVEELYFEYEVNSNPTPDFEEAGVELKCTPLKTLNDGTFQIKERLVCNMIDYGKVINEPFEESHFFKKCAIMLLLFYLHEANVEVYDLKFIYSVLWKLSGKDLLIIKQDYETIISKIKAGEAHLLSEGDTMYLGACRKGQKGQKDVQQPYSDKLAPKRAFSLKQSYMRTVLKYIEEQGEKAVSNYEISLNYEPLVSEEELQQNTFEDIIIEKYSPYIGLNYKELCEQLSLNQSTAKHKYSIVANAIANSNMTTIDESEEFQKSGIRLKTVRVKHSGTIEQSMSFENIDYTEIYENEDWFESRLYEIFSSRFLFVIFKQKEPNKTIILNDEIEETEFVLDKVFFWTMPQEDLNDAEIYWNNIREKVLNNQIDLKNFFSLADDKKFHVRPKGTITSYKNAAINPHGGKADKYCYWFNAKYVKQIIENN